MHKVNIKMKKFIRFIIWLIAVTPLIFYPYLRSVFSLPKLVWIFFVVILLFWLCLREKLFNYVNTFIVPIGLLFFWLCIVLIRCTNIFAGIHSILIFLLFVTFYICFEDVVAGDRSLIDIFIKGIIFVSIVVCIYGILQVCGIDFIRWNVKNTASSSLGRRNFAGEYLVMVIPYAFYFLYRERKKWIYIPVFLLILHLILTFTRASYIGFFVSVIIFFILTGRKARINRKAVILLLILFFSRSVFSGIHTFERGTVKSRLLIWNVTLKMIRSNPLFGVGPGNFVIMYPFYGIGEEKALRGVSLVVDRAHNDYLEVCAESGVIGLLLFFYFLFCIFKVLFTLYRETDGYERILTVSIISSVVGMCVNALASFPFNNPATLLLFWVNVSFAGAMYRKLKGEKRVNMNYSLLRIYFVLFCLAGFIMSVMGIKASYYMFLAKNTKDKTSLYFAEKAVLYNPYSMETTFLAAKTATKYGEYERAYRYISMEKQLEPYSASLYHNLGLVYFHLMNFREAEESFLYSLKLNPEVPDVHNTLGVLYLNTGRYDEAITCFIRAITLKSDFDFAYYNLGLVYYIKQDYQKAVEYLRKTLEINPDFEDAKKIITDIENNKH